MMNKYDQKEELIIEEAFKLREEGRRLSHIIEKFPEYKNEIREIFGIVAFVKENKDKNYAPKNVLKTIISKLPEGFNRVSASVFKEETPSRSRIYLIEDELNEKEENNASIFEPESNPSARNNWKVAVPIIMILVIIGLFLMRKDSNKKNTAENNATSTQAINAFELTGSVDDALPALGQ